MEVRFLGHACFELSNGDTRVLIDPFLSGNPKAAVSAEDVNPTAILLTHGHGDHFGDTVEIAKRTGAPVLAIVEIARERLVTQIVLGQPVRSRWEELLRGSIINRLLRLSTDIDIHLVPRTDNAADE